MFDLSHVTSVYSGRKGCACGCRGKYAYASAHAEARPDYYKGDDGISDRSVKSIAGKVDRLLHDPEAPVARVLLDPDGEWLAVDLEHDRTYTVYFS